MVEELFNNAIQNMKNAFDKTFGVLNDNKVVVACSEASKVGTKINFQVNTELDAFTFEGNSFKSILVNDNQQYTIFVEGVGVLCNTYASIIAITFTNIKDYYDEKYNRGRFIKDIILDNILPGDIYIKSRALCFDTDVARTVMVIRSNEQIDVSIHKILQNIFPDRTKDFIININDNEVALVKMVSKDIDNRDIENLATSISENLIAEYNIRAVIGIGSVVTNLKHLARSFKEAQTSLEVAKVFDEEKKIVSYDNLGVARLVYQLPTTLCETYLSEILKRGSIDMLDEETLFTIQKFFENNLNVSETARQMYIHRNTLLYRIEKVKKVTGLDLKIFDHAAAFKIALMVNKYLKSNPNRF